MIKCMYPLPNRYNILSNYGYIGGYESTMNQFISSAIFRNIALLPIYFYKCISTWGDNLICEHVFATDSIQINDSSPMVPISVKIREPFLYSSRQLLFAKNINYLLSIYNPNTGMLNSNILSGNHFNFTVKLDTRIKEIIGFHEWCRLGLNGLYRNYLMENCDLIPSISKAQLCLNDISSVLGVLLEIDSSSDTTEFVYGTNADTPLANMGALEEILMNLDCDPQTWVTEQISSLQTDLLTLTCLRSPSYIFLKDIKQYCTNPLFNEDIKQLAYSTALASENYNGLLMPLSNIDNDGYEVFSIENLYDGINNIHCSDWTIQVDTNNHNITMHDIFGSMGRYDQQLLNTNIVNSLREIFMFIGHHHKFPKGRNITMTKTFLDEVFIVVETQKDILTYYWPLPYMCMVSPALCNVFN